MRIKLLSFMLLGLGFVGCHTKNDVKPVDPVVVQPEVVQERAVTIHFDFDSVLLTKDQKVILDDVVKQNKVGTKVLIVGHTDSQGSPQYNQALSEKRAAAVSQYLRDAKVENDAVGKGETKLLNKDKTKLEHKLNRRAEIFFKVLAK